LGEAKSIHPGDQRLQAGLQESDEKKSSRLVLEACNEGRAIPPVAESYYRVNSIRDNFDGNLRPCGLTTDIQRRNVYSSTADPSPSCHCPLASNPVTGRLPIPANTGNGRCRYLGRLARNCISISQIGSKLAAVGQAEAALDVEKMKIRS
jgi:hypothetical protein